MYCTGAANDEEQQIRQATDERGASAWGGGVPLSGALSAIGGGRQCAPGRGRCACWGRRCVPVGGRCVCLGRGSLGTARVAGYGSTLYRIRAGCKLMRACKTAVQAHRRVQYSTHAMCHAIGGKNRLQKKTKKTQGQKNTHTRQHKQEGRQPNGPAGQPVRRKTTRNETKEIHKKEYVAEQPRTQAGHTRDGADSVGASNQPLTAAPPPPHTPRLAPAVALHRPRR